MRAIMTITFAAMLVLSAWANNLNVADAGQTGPVSNNPISMMASATDLPVQQYPGF